MTAAATHDLPGYAPPARLERLVLILLPLFLLQIALYYRSFGVKPASDDFPVVHEILRGNAQGPGVFFRESMSNMHHRPFKSLSIWAFGQISDVHRVFWIRVLHFIGMAFYLFVLAIWLARMNLSSMACAVAGMVMLFHPVLPQALSSIDGIDGIAASALIWLGAWCVLVWRDRIAPALIATVICFILAAGWKEYSFAIVPLATWTMLCFGERHRWRNAAVLFAGLCVVFAGVIIVRQHAIPAGFGTIHGAEYASVNPIQWMENGAIIASGLLFFGNSIWVYVHQSAAVLMMVAVCMLIAIATITVGLCARIREPATRRWLVFLAGGFVAASFPVNVIFHISEMYLSPLLLPLALVCAIAADGWRRQSTVARIAACAVAITALISSAITVHAKVEGLRDVGQRAEDQMRQILALLPTDAHDLKVAMVFDPAELSPRRTYAVYRMGDEVLVVHSMALDWLAPERHLYLGSFLLGSPDFHPEQFDYVFKWDPTTKRFAPWRPSPPAG